MENAPSRLPFIGLLVPLWPKWSETFVLDEAVELERLGHRLRVVALKSSGERPLHMAQAALESKAEALDARRRPLLAARALAGWLLSHPRRTLSAAALAFRFAHGVQRILQGALAAEFFARGGAPDLLYAHFPSAIETAAVAARLLDIPLVAKLHGAKEIPRPALETATLLTASRDLGSRLGLPSRVAPPGVPDFFYAAAPPPLRARIVAAGRLEPKKGFGVLIAAAGLLARRGVDFELMIAGEGRLRKHLESAAAGEKISARIVLTGVLAQEELARLLAAGGVFVLPSVPAGPEGLDMDDLPRVVLEAMAAGLCPAASAVGAVREVVEDGVEGLLLPAGDAAALANALARLFADQDLRSRLAAGARARAERFRVARSSGRVSDLLVEASSHRPARSARMT